MSFKNQAEIYQALLEGKTITGDLPPVTTNKNKQIKLIGGYTHTFIEHENRWNREAWEFTFPEYWSLYVEPPKPRKYKLTTVINGKCIPFEFFDRGVKITVEEIIEETSK